MVNRHDGQGVYTRTHLTWIIIGMYVGAATVIATCTLIVLGV